MFALACGTEVAFLLYGLIGAREQCWWNDRIRAIDAGPPRSSTEMCGPQTTTIGSFEPG
jgi:hypothetical protein